jgi:hypothetical protein
LILHNVKRITSLVDLAVAKLYEGVDIDYRRLDQNLRRVQPVRQRLANRLHEQGKTQHRVEPRCSLRGRRRQVRPDWQTLGLLADAVKVPAPGDRGLCRRRLDAVYLMPWARSPP